MPAFNGPPPCCPICLSSAGVRNSGDSQLVDCPRCGPYEISRTAVTILTNSAAERDRRAVLSHAVRSQTSEKNRFKLFSTNLKEIMDGHLPPIPGQLENLLEWVSMKIGADIWGAAELPDTNHLAGVVGVLDASSVMRVLEYAVSEGYATLSGNSSAVSITPKGREFMGRRVDAKLGATAAGDIASRPLGDHVATPAQPQIVLVHCNRCGGERNHARHTVYEKIGESEGYETAPGHFETDKRSLTFEIFECCGCGDHVVRRTEWDSAHDEIYEHPISGKEVLRRHLAVKHWPAPARRLRPAWLERIADAELSNTLGELYDALDGDMAMLSASGARTAFDRACVLDGANAAGSFAQKLQWLLDQRRVGQDEYDNLVVLADAGGSASHRGWKPSTTSLSSIMDSLEAYIHRALVLKADMAKVKAELPPRQKKRTKPKK